VLIHVDDEKWLALLERSFYRSTRTSILEGRTEQMADRLFTDVRRFATPPGRPVGSERFERPPPRVTLGGLVRALFGRPAVAAAEADALPAYLDWDLPRSHARRTRGTI
jgi:hypothetical protein